MTSRRSNWPGQPLMHWNHALYAISDGQYSSVVPAEQRGGVPRHVEIEKWRILPVGEVHDHPAALAGGHRRNAPWARVSASRSEQDELEPVSLGELIHQHVRSRSRRPSRGAAGCVYLDGFVLRVRSGGKVVSVPVLG